LNRRSLASQNYVEQPSGRAEDRGPEARSLLETGQRAGEGL